MAKDFPDPDMAYHQGFGMAFNPYAGKVVPSIPAAGSPAPRPPIPKPAE